MNSEARLSFILGAFRFGHQAASFLVVVVSCTVFVVASAAVDDSHMLDMMTTGAKSPPTEELTPTYHPDSTPSQQPTPPTTPNVPANDNGLVVTQGLVMRASTLANTSSPSQARTIRIKMKNAGQWNVDYCFDSRFQVQSSAGNISVSEGVLHFIDDMIDPDSVSCDLSTMQIVLHAVSGLYLRYDEVLNFSLVGDWSVGEKPAHAFFEISFSADQRAPSPTPTLLTTSPANAATSRPSPTPTSSVDTEQAISDIALALSILGCVFVVFLAVVITMRVRKFLKAKKEKHRSNKFVAEATQGPALTEVHLLDDIHSANHDALRANEVVVSNAHTATITTTEYSNNDEIRSSEVVNPLQV